MKLKMEDLPRKIRREIKKANKLSNKFRRKMGLKNAKSRCTDDTFTEIEVKCSYEDFIAGKIPSIEEAKEYAYFYERDDNYFGAEKIKNGKLKEFYEKILIDSYANYGINVCSVKIETLKSIDILNLINSFIKNKKYNFIVNGIEYYPSYFSINAKTLKKEHLYFYPVQYGSTIIRNISKYHGILYGKKRYFEIFRYSFISNKIDKIYVEDILNDNDKIFYYFDVENNIIDCHEILMTIKT